ncbi:MULTISPECIES: EamA family transporter [Paenibacillus]|uniref:EamA family transporter n=1 Tax=Paenibacillus TaxID=44249 RepID=UPI0022B8F396|nr:DMT family transporter [Paenibacillus caseinilyticus]MCZ8518681.1 DMT family transporter [Paenibacillus caseinilyticus]
MNKLRLRACLLVLLGAASYGVLSTFVKLAYADGFTPGEVTGSQVLLGCAITWLLVLAGIGRGIPAIPPRVRWKLLGSGMFTGLTGVFYYYALQSLDASFAVLLLFQFTWMGMVADWVLQGRVPTRFRVLGIVIVLAGTVLASGLLDGTLLDRVSPSGIGLGLAAAASYTLFIYFSGKVAVEVPALWRSAWMLTGASVAVSVIYPPQFLWNGALGNGLLLWGFLLGLFGMIVPSYMYAKGAPKIDTGLTAILGAVELPVVIVFSALLLHEQTGIREWAGIGLILAGIVFSELGGSRRQEEAAVAGPKPGAEKA